MTAPCAKPGQPLSQGGQHEERERADRKQTKPGPPAPSAGHQCQAGECPGKSIYTDADCHQPAQTSHPPSDQFRILETGPCGAGGADLVEPRRIDLERPLAK